MIAVVGATGNTGRAVMKELKALGEDPIAVVRNPDKAVDVLGSDVKTVVAELTDPAGLKKALTGVSRVFVVTGHNPDMAVQQNNVLDAALAAGAKYLVRVGGGAAVARADSESVVGRGHYAIEQRLKASGIGWVILRPGLFMQNTFGQAGLIRGEGKIAAAVGRDVPVAFLDVRDTGAVGARILLDPAPHVRRTYEFTGAQTSYGAFAEVFSEVLGRPVTYVQTTLEQTEKALRARDMPDWLVEHLLVIARLTAEGAFSKENTKPVHAILGRPPLTTRQFVEDHKAMFS
jgi:uncharacterized protein YbjT (DUF2867 family)